MTEFFEKVPDGVEEVCYFDQDDRANEDKIARRIIARTGGEIVRFPKFYPIDFWRTRDGVKADALIEVKTRTHTVEKFETVFFNVRKHDFLVTLAARLQVPPIFVVAFSEEKMRWIEVPAYPEWEHGIVRWTKKRCVTCNSDTEPVWKIPVTEMRKL